MEIDVAFHKWHVVAGPVGGTVTSVDGSKTFCTIPEGGQGTFYATVTKVVTSDDSITVDEVVNFNCAPVKLWLLGLTGRGADALPSGYLAAEFLESTGTQRIRTGLPATNLTCVEIEFADVENDNWATPVATFSSYGGVGYTIYAKGSVGTASRVPRFDYGSSESAEPTYNVSVGRHTMRKEANRNFIDGVEVKANAESGDATWAELYLLYFRSASTFMRCKLYGYKKWELDGILQQNFIPAIDSAGTPCMYDLVSKQPFRNEGSGQFIAGFTLAQARKLSKLPATGGTLTVSLPWEALDDARVQAALAKAAENGWTIVEQYREPEAAAENIAADFLESTGTQWIDTDLVVENLSFKLDYAGIKNVNGTGNGDQLFGVENPMGNFYGVTIAVNNNGLGYNLIATQKYPNNIYDVAPYSRAIAEINLTDLYTYLKVEGKWQRRLSISNETQGYTVKAGLFSRQGGGIRSAGRVYSFKADYLTVPAANYSPSLDRTGTPCMYDKVSGENFYNSGGGAFIVGFETVEAARNLAKLPKVEAGELTVSLPAEARDAASMVPTAISIAVSRGWTIIEQYRED